MTTKEENFDIFIAYHGDEITGSQNAAKHVYNLINDAEIGNKKIRAFFKPITSPHGNFSETPQIVARTPLFLLVANQNIPRNASGQICERDNGNLRYLYEEVIAFHSSKYYKQAPVGTAAKLLLCGDFDYEAAENLHSIFSGTTAFKYTDRDLKANLLNWIQSSINNKCDNEDNPVLDNIENQDEIDWTKERAKTWHYMNPPSKPSISELALFKEFFEKVKHAKSRAEKPKVLILGSTVEFRILAADEEFDITVVDYSKDYYNEISNDLPDGYNIGNETYIHCNWCEMAERLNRKFDIIIGDLAIGNISPDNIEKFYENISKLLSDSGYLLGKSIYMYSDYTINETSIKKLLNDVTENIKIDKNNIYSHIMYPLSIYASKPYTRNKNEVFAAKIDFEALYNCILQYTSNLSDDKKSKFSIYLDETTQFNKKMPSNFYIYSYLSLLNQLENSEMFIEDVLYSTEIYKNDFPLLVIRKKQVVSNSFPRINSFLVNNLNSFTQDWNNAISSIYYLNNIVKIDNKELIKKVATILNKAKISINSNLDYFLSNIPDKILGNETKSLAANTLIVDNKKLKNNLQFNYICGILISIINHIKIQSQQKISASSLDLILQALFKNKEQGKLWNPQKSPWLSARICICLHPLYEQWKKTPTSEYDKYMSQLEDVVILIDDMGSEKKRLFWDSETGSHFDTAALCIETLYLYSEYIPTLKEKLKAIINKYVSSNHIKETFIKYPIFNNLIDEVCSCKTINGTAAYKKLCGRIEWYTILYKICKDWSEKEPNKDLFLMSEYIAIQLKKFWRLFTERATDIIKVTIDKENSIVPQILYCLKRTNLFE